MPMAGVIAVYSMKGGVGKTTLATNIAWCSAQLSGLHTLLWDLDAQGGAAFLLGEEKVGKRADKIFSGDVDPARRIAPTRFPGLDILAADLSLRSLEHDLAEADKPKRLKKLLKQIGEDYRRIVIDCPPGLGEISDQIFRAADLVVMPVEPTPMALRSLDMVRDHLQEHHKGGPRLLPVLSIADRRKKLHVEMIETHPDWPVIPASSSIERMAIEQAPVRTYAPKAARAFADLWGRIAIELTSV